MDSQSCRSLHQALWASKQADLARLGGIGVPGFPWMVTCVPHSCAWTKFGYQKAYEMYHERWDFFLRLVAWSREVPVSAIVEKPSPDLHIWGWSINAPTKWTLKQECTDLTRIYLQWHASPLGTNTAPAEVLIASIRSPFFVDSIAIKFSAQLQRDYRVDRNLFQIHQIIFDKIGIFLWDDDILNDDTNVRHSGRGSFP